MEAERHRPTMAPGKLRYAIHPPASQGSAAPHLSKFGRLPAVGAFQFGDVQLDHAHHRLHRPLAASRVGAPYGLEKLAWRHLPGEAEPVGEPAALRRLSTLDQPVPVVVDLSLVVAVDDEG